MAIYNLGSVNIDHVYRVPHLPEPGETLASTSFNSGLGGKGANQSIAIARAGGQVFHIGAIGADGGWLADQMKAAGVDTRFLSVIDVPTGHAIINVDDEAENVIVLFTGANRALTEAMVNDALSDAGAGDWLLLQNETNLTRRSIVDIIMGSDRLQDFKNNPQKFIEQVAAIIKHQMRIFIVDGIKYQKIGDQHYYAQELYEENELYGYLSKNMLESKKSVFDHVVYDSDVEADFAKSFELSDDVKVYAKLPGWFKIDTPLGSYNPDWAVLVELEGQPRLYFVMESKGSLFSEALRVSENAKIKCGREHFKALESNVGFMVANNYTTFSEKVSATELEAENKNHT